MSVNAPAYNSRQFLYAIARGGQASRNEDGRLRVDFTEQPQQVLFLGNLAAQNLLNEGWLVQQGEYFRLTLKAVQFMMAQLPDNATLRVSWAQHLTLLRDFTAA